MCQVDLLRLIKIDRKDQGSRSKAEGCFRGMSDQSFTYIIFIVYDCRLSNDIQEVKIIVKINSIVKVFTKIG